jgi:hypothetical protein
MPVFVINGDKNFDLSGIARREGLDLFKSDRVCLIDAVHSPQDSQTERLWDDWPACLEDNKNNLRAELDRIVEGAKTDGTVNHVILFVVDRFAPSEVHPISRDILQDVYRKITARDARGFGTETGESKNVWIVVFVRPVQNPEAAAQQAESEKEKCDEVNNVFVSAFNGNPSDRPASDFAALRVLSELLLDQHESRRFLQPIQQNAYPVAYLFGPNIPPRAGASRLLQRGLLGTLDRLLAFDAPAEGSKDISEPAKLLEKRVEELVAKAKEDIGTPSQVDTATADQNTSQALEIRSGFSDRDAANLGTIERAIDGILARFVSGLKWQRRNHFDDVRRDLREQIGSERKEFEEQKRTWARGRPRVHLTDFAAINVQVIKTIEDDLSRVAIGSRGNDIATLDGLITAVGKERNILIADANTCYASTNLPEGQRSPEEYKAAVDDALRAFEFELDQVPQFRSVMFYFWVSLLAALGPYILLLVASSLHRLLYLSIGALLAILVLTAAILAISRRQKKLRQAAAALRDKLASWRLNSIRFFNNALRYQVLTLGVGWLGAAIEKLDQIKRSIAARNDALEDCKQMLNTPVRPEDDDAAIQKLITEGVQQLSDERWDKWIVEFLTKLRPRDSKADATIDLVSDGDGLQLSVPGLVKPLTVRIQIPRSRTPTDNK